jgi:hypothetical protein
MQPTVCVFLITSCVPLVRQRINSEALGCCGVQSAQGRPVSRKRGNFERGCSRNTGASGHHTVSYAYQGCTQEHGNRNHR